MVTNTDIQELGHFINGQTVLGKSGHFSDVYNPSTGSVIARVPLATQEEVKEAINGAQKAFPAWRALSVGKRAEIMLKFRQLLTDNMDELIDLICKESGKTKEDAKGEITRGLESVDLAINAPHLLKGEYSVNVGGQINAYSTKAPLGVVAAISPFNFPVMVPLAITSMAIAVGNCVILKPSERVPCSALYLSELWTKAGLPDGVWTVINGDKDAVNELLSNPLIEAVSFVGSTPVAEAIYATASKHGKRVTALGGGKNNMVVMPDADLEHVANAFLGAAYGAASQRCMAISTIIPVGEDTANKLVTILADKITKLKVGPYTDSDVDFGPVITQHSKETIIGYIDRSLQEGATIVCDGRHPEIAKQSQGFYLGPTLLDHVVWKFMSRKFLDQPAIWSVWIHWMKRLP